MKKEFRRFAVWSNAFYLIPLIVAWDLHLVLVSVALVFVILFSTAFHAFDEQEFVHSDIYAAVAVLLLDIALSYFGGFRPILLALVGILAAAAVLVRLLVERGDRGGTAHGYWHLLAATVTLGCIILYAASVLA